MNPRCIAAVTQAATKLGRQMTKAELNDIESKTREMSRAIAKKDPAAWRGMTKAEQMAEVGTALAKEFEHQAALKATRAAKDAITAAKNLDYLEKATAKGMTGARALMHKLGFIPDGKGGTVDAEYRAKAIANEHLEAMRPLLDLDKKGSLFGLFSNEQGQMDVLREYRGIDTGNAEAKKAAASLRDTIDSAMNRYNEVGGDIRKLKDYVPQRQDQYRVYKAGMKAWVDDAMMHIDRETLVDLNGAVLDDAKARTFLEEAWWNIATDGMGKEKKKPGMFGVNQSIANRHKQHRQLHWKSPESYMTMQEKYGGGNLIDQTKAYVERLAHETVLMEQFGSNALHQIELLTQKAQEIDKAKGMERQRSGVKDKVTEKLYSEYNHLDAMVEKFAGINQGVTGSFKVNRFFSFIKNMNIANKLGSILTSQLADNGTAIATARALNIPLKDWMEMKARGYGDAEVKRMAQSNAIAFDVMIDNMVRFGDDTDPTTISGKLAQATMKISGANFFTQMHRTAFASLVESHVGQLTRQFDWNSLPAKDKAIFESKGFTELDWNIMRAATPDAETGLLGMKQIKDVDLEQIKQMMPGEIAKIQQDAAEFVQRMEAKNQQEAGWVQNRQQKFNEYKDKIQKLIDDYISTREKRVEDYASMNLKRGGELMARLEQAEVDAEISKAAIAEKDADRSAKFMDDVKRGVEWYGRRRSEIGEQLGAKRHSAKLQAAAADRAYTKLSESLISKKNELFGPERVEDGFVVIGKVTKAAEAFDAYTAKMEKRIENSYKRNGDLKAGKAGTVERAERLKEDARIEFEAIKQAADNSIAELKSKVTGSQMEIRGLIDAIEAKKERAAAEADIVSYLETEKSTDKIQAMLDTLDFRRDQSAARNFTKGEELGYRKAMAESRVKQMAKREEAYAKQADKEVFSKASEFEKRIDKRLAELEEFTNKFDEKAQERSKWATEYEAKVGSKIESAAEVAKRDAYLKLTAMALQEAEMAVLQPNLHSTTFVPLRKGEMLSELGAAALQFKSFAIAFANNHLIQRAGSMNSPAMYRLGLLATTTVLGGMGLMLNDLAQGKDPRDVYDPENPYKSVKFGMQALVKGGGLSIAGDLLNVFMEEGARPATEQLTGPFFGQVSKTLKVGQEAAQGDANGTAKAAINLGREFVPFNNLIWTRAVWNNYLMAELNELASPGYKGRMRGLAEKNYGQDYFLGMGVEPRAPNLLAPIGQ